MASAGFLLLLLMSTSFILSGLSSPPCSNQQDGHSLQKRGKTTQKVLTAAEYAAKIVDAVSPFIGLIPGYGTCINAVLSIFTTAAGAAKTDETLKFLKVEFQNLNEKIDEYHTEVNWNFLAQDYGTHEKNIRLAWDEFQKLLNILKKEQRKNYFNEFIKNFKNKFVLSTKSLHKLMTAKQPSFNSEIGKVLSEKFRCHEQTIKGYTLLTADLFNKGNTVEFFYNTVKKVPNAEELAKIAYESAKVMFEIHKHCISEIDKYVKLDVSERIDVNKNRNELAQDIRKFLDKTYVRYNWMVVAYKTQNSQHKSQLTKWLNRHKLSEAFIKLEKGDVTVAVAKQVKGTHTKASKVTEDIEKCLTKEPECKDVIKKLETCEGTKDKYTAVHVYIFKCHESSLTLEAAEASDDPPETFDSDNPDCFPYIYSGNCKKLKIMLFGHFRVLIKSDEEIMKKSPCDKLNCGNNGKFVVLDKIPVCDCEDRFYGEGCEESVEGYKNDLEKIKMPEM